jgi:hypothetical protein
MDGQTTVTVRVLPAKGLETSRPIFVIAPGWTIRAPADRTGRILDDTIQLAPPFELEPESDQVDFAEFVSPDSAHPISVEVSWKPRCLPSTTETPFPPAISCSKSATTAKASGVYVRLALDADGPHLQAKRVASPVDRPIR